MTQFEFSESAIDESAMSFGVDIRPEIIIQNEKDNISLFYDWASREYPELFEQLLLSPSQFKIQKSFEFPGKGSAVIDTLILTKRGPVLRFPEKLSALQEEISIPNKREVFEGCLKRFLTLFSNHDAVRVGVVWELVFNTQKMNSCELLATRINGYPQDALDELNLKLRYIREGKNISITLANVRAVRQSIDPNTGAVIKMEPSFYGIQVKLDINNTDMSNPIDGDRIAGVISFAIDFRNTELMNFLNGGAVS